ncbi:hypothetical protein GCM10009548_36540 [Streptomyces malaysiensis subsp. malaysiensis]
MSKTWAVVPACLSIVLRRCDGCASGPFRANGEFRVNADHKLLNTRLFAPCTRCGGTADERPAWQSPYGPSPHRAHRGRWAPVPGVAWSRSAVRRGHLCGRCD